MVLRKGLEWNWALACDVPSNILIMVGWVLLIGFGLRWSWNTNANNTTELLTFQANDILHCIICVSHVVSNDSFSFNEG